MAKTEDYDFSNETALALEWVFVEAYYDYDERGANLDNILSFSSVTTTADVQNILQGYAKKQWIPIDALVKTYNRTKNEIVHDSANLNTQNFWNGFLQYTGTLSPLQKYAQDLKILPVKIFIMLVFNPSMSVLLMNFKFYRQPYHIIPIPEKSAAV